MNASSTSWMASSWQSLRDNFLPSIVVFLVALPLCMGIAIASGVPVAAGLITGIVGGLIVGFLAGSPLQVSGPAAGLTVIVFEVVREHGIAALGIVVLIAGLAQIAAGVFRLGQWFRAVPPSVIHGMLAGIGVLIVASQFHVMVDDKPKGGGLANLATIPAAIQKGLPLPEWTSAEDRGFRSQTLKSIAALHARQIDLSARIDIRIGAAETAEQLAKESEFIAELGREQHEITEALAKIVAQVDAYIASQAGHAALPAAHQAGVEALAASRAAETTFAGEVHPVELKKAQAAAEESLTSFLGSLKNHDWAAKIGILTILLIVAWKLVAPKKLKLIPPALIAVVVATAICAIFVLPVVYVEVPQNLLHGITVPSVAVLTEVHWFTLIELGLAMAFVASAETLLCAVAVDQMHQGPRTQYDRELVAQGVGNTICGLFGALPMTGVIVRSSANVEAGATNRLSAILHGLWLLVFVVVLGFLINMIPTAALAAMLVYTGWKLINIKVIRELWKYGRGEVAIYIVTVLTIVGEDLLTGVIVGVLLSAAKLLIFFSRLDIHLESDLTAQRSTLQLEGAATFIRLPQLAAELARVPKDSELHVDFERLDYIDHACLDLLMNWAKQHAATGGQLVIDWSQLHGRLRTKRKPGEGSRHRTRPRAEKVVAQGDGANGDGVNGGDTNGEGANGAGVHAVVNGDGGHGDAKSGESSH